MKIEWLISGSSPDWKEENYQDGGYVYDTFARKILRELYPVSITYLSRGRSESKIKRFVQLGKYLKKNVCINFSGDIVIRDIYSTVFAPFDSNRINIVILHHLDTSGFKYKKYYNLFTKRFFQKILLANKVVVVSEYWKKLLEKKGCSNVEIIYNSFDLSQFEFEQNDLIDFQRKLHIPRGKPIIYLGNARPEKGYIEAFKVLKNIDAAFITTGKNSISLPIFHYYLSYRDYLRLLKISSIVITMSTFNEGWCRTSIEAMLCGTPVIGSGKGGMKELLEKGGQLICDDFGKLNLLVADLLNNRRKIEEMKINGKGFASNFTIDYFKKKWLALISKLSV